MLHLRHRLAAVALGCQLALTAAACGSPAGSAGVLVQVSGPSPFAGCAPADLDEVFQEGALEPSAAVNPTNPANVVGVWMQDRLRGIVAGVSVDGGATWRQVVIPGLTRCNGGELDYAVEPWLSFGPNGDLHLSATVFDDSDSGGIAASRARDGGGPASVFAPCWTIESEVCCRH